MPYVKFINNFIYKVKTLLSFIGYDRRNWLRLAQIRSWVNYLDSIQPLGDVLEISPGWNNFWKNVRCRTYFSVDYPQFDICNMALDDTFDIIIADQVLEHVRKPSRAIHNIFKMLRPNGVAMIATPFLFRVHARPNDFSRWTEEGLREILIEGGFSQSQIITESWGNKSCAKAHIGGPVRDYGFYRNMKNDSEYPLMVWAFAKKI